MPSLAKPLSQQQEQKAVLRVEDLHTWFEVRRMGFFKAGDVRALDGVSFELYEGETISIVGESGCGKSTLAKTILGINHITKGSVHFLGEDLSTLDKEGWKRYRSNIGYIQQDPYGALPPFMNVQRILEEPMKINGIKDKEEQQRRIRQVLEEVKLAPIEDFLPKFPHMLSGGQQQRLVIARAMILEPKMLIADEPVSMLDASVRIEILQLLQALQRRHNLAIIYITHDLSTVRYFSERIFTMYGGKIIEKSSTQALLKEPLHPYTKALFEATSDPDVQNLYSYKDIPSGEPPSLMNPPKGCRFHPRCRQIIKGLCDQQMPPEFWVRDDHAALCWLYKDEKNA
ncbi:MAG: ABC transporter ATP-binding protein [Bacillota bacterium]|jgi:peptide/nickel transport system ATP-binding protein|nr:ABC transporter ATP-binding protein [Bacillota bacterium]NLJ03590.1 ABC transporter ATP-binding protein [Bacillota bacterium]